MITREQLQGFANVNGVPLFTQERDYVQALFLSRLYKLEAPLIFKGGYVPQADTRLATFFRGFGFHRNVRTG